MTQDYKNNLLNYLVGKVDTTEADNVPTIIGAETIQNNLATFCANNGINGFVINGILGSKTNELTACYGYYIVTENDTDVIYGAIVILDKDLFPISAITKFPSGTYLGQIEKLEYDDENYIYGIDETVGTSSRKRFIMLNNFLESGTISLRKSYYLPTGDDYSYFSAKNLHKKVGEAKYLLIGTTKDTDFNYYPCVIELTIEYGASNTWNLYKYTSAGSMSVFHSLVSWKTSSYSAVFYGVVDSSSSLIYKEFILKDGSFTLKKTITNSSYTGNEVKGIGTIDGSNVYILVVVGSVLYTLKIDDMLLNVIEELTLDSSWVLRIANIDTSNDILIMSINYRIGSAISPTYYGSFPRLIVNDTIIDGNPVQIANTGIENNAMFLTTIKKYNLYNLVMQMGNVIYKYHFTYNSTNYNGSAIIQLGSTQPNSMQLKDEYNDIVFDRNLYNVEVYNNVIESKMQVPNTFLNDSTISGLELLSSYNNELFSQSGLNVTKNQYESLIFNVNNTIKMINGAYYNVAQINGQNRLANSSAKLLDYDNAKARLFRIIKTNGIFERPISDDEITYNSSTNTYTYRLLFVLDNDSVTNYQILSADGNTIYLDLPAQTTGTGSYYFIIEVTIS